MPIDFPQTLHGFQRKWTKNNLGSTKYVGFRALPTTGAKLNLGKCV